MADARKEKRIRVHSMEGEVVGNTLHVRGTDERADEHGTAQEIKVAGQEWRRSNSEGERRA